MGRQRPDDRPTKPGRATTRRADVLPRVRPCAAPRPARRGAAFALAVHVYSRLVQAEPLAHPTARASTMSEPWPTSGASVTRSSKPMLLEPPGERARVGVEQLGRARLVVARPLERVLERRAPRILLAAVLRRMRAHARGLLASGSRERGAEVVHVDG